MAKNANRKRDKVAESQFSRFQMELDEDMAEEMDRLQLIGGLRTRKELLSVSVALLTWLARDKSFGCDIFSVDPDGAIRELTSPFLDTVQIKASKGGKPVSSRPSFRIVRGRVDEPGERERTPPTTPQRASSLKESMG